MFMKSIKKNKTSTILEIGCGQGFNTQILAKNKKNDVIGIDLSKDEIKIARKRYKTVRFEVMNAENLKFKDNTFDKIYAIQILEHVDNLSKVLDEISRVLKPRGKVIISVPYHKSEKWLLKIRPTYFKEIHHVRIFKENELERLCKKRNLFLKMKKQAGFLQHIELYLLFKRKVNSKTQVSIGSWRDNIGTKFVHVTMLCFEPLCLSTPLKYFPLWIITIPLGSAVNNIGNIFFPKSLDYEFIKK